MISNDQIELPDIQLTAGDLVGRVVRIVRRNWFPLLRFFIGPMIWYQASYECLWWDPDRYDSNLPATVSFWIVALGVIFNFLSLWELEIRKFALLLFLAKKSQNLEDALKKAQKKMWLILILAVPIFAAEAGTNVLSFFTTKLAESSEHMSFHDPLMIWSLGLTAVEFMLLIPFLCIGMLNVFYIAILIFEDLSILKACARFWTLLTQSFSYTSMYMVLMGCVFAPALSLIALIMPIVIFLPQNALRFVLSSIATVILLTPVDAFWAISVVIGGALLYAQLTAKLEGRDLLDKLAHLEAK
jgi:hypothetical protein